MSNSQGKDRRPGRVLGTVASLMVALGAILFAVGYHNHDSSSREVGLLVEMVGVFLLMRASVVRDRARRAQSQSTDGGETPVPTTSRLNRIIRVLGTGFVLLGVVLFAVGSFAHGWTPRIYGLLAAFLGVVFIRGSFDRMPSPGTSLDKAVPKAVKRFDRVMRVIGIILVPLLPFSTVAFFLTPPTSHEAWPLYTFLLVGLACTLVWSYLFARLIVRLAVEGWGRR